MRLLLPLLVAALLCGACFDGRGEREERVAAAPGGLLEVDLDRGAGLRPDPGALVVRTHAAPEVRVVWEASEWGASGVHFRIDRQGDAVRVIGRVSGATSWMFGGPRIELRIWVPREFSADLRCSGGAVRVEDLAGRVAVRTEGDVEIARVEGPLRVRANGGVRLAEVSGNVDVRLDEGDIEASWIRGDAELRTDWGEIEARHVEGRLVARSARGSLDVRDLSGPVEAVTERGGVYASFLRDPEGRLETSRGSLEVLLPETARTSLDAVTRSGSVEIGSGLRIPGEQTRERVTGPLNGGGSPLRLFTASGSIQVRPR
jgi:hypothetical protein